jgi:NAD(P)H dehydrogenase (quinone)
MKDILIISGHTDLAASVANRTILETLGERLPEAEIVKLDELYPDFKIDVENEQRRLLRADIIVLQFPVFWYSVPSILERWMEETFRHGFSHGSTGDKLKGKKLVLSFTTGAPEEMYSHDGPMGYTIDEFLPCYKATCRLTQMEYCGYVYTGGVSYGNRTSLELVEQQKVMSMKHAERLIRLLDTL